MAATVPNPVIAYEPPAARRRLASRLRGAVVLLAVVGSATWAVFTLVRDPGRWQDLLIGRPTEIDFRTLGAFSFDDQAGTLADVPAAARALDGRRVRLNGFMFQPEQLLGPPGGYRFQFAYDPPSPMSRFRGPPLVQERVMSTAGRDTKLYDRYTLCDVVGTLHVRLKRDPLTGRVVSVFDLDVESTKPAGK